MESTSFTAGAPLFKFSSLPENDSFRLLRLLPDLEQDPVRCELITTTISRAAGSYVAGSYTWGTPLPTMSILLNNISVDVRKNLYDFLRKLRKRDKAVVIWIDAFCINQDCHRERTHQVGLMAQVYSEAASVAIWLGPGSELMYYAIDIIEKLGTDSTIHIDPKSGPAVFEDDGTENEKTAEVAAFFNVPWWFRVWTVQEYVLAKRRTFYCGDRKIEGEVVEEFSKNVAAHRGNCCSRIMVVHRTHGLRMNMGDSIVTVSMLKDYCNKHSATFLSTLGRFEFRLATDPKDRIYGFLGIARQNGGPFLDALYEQSPQEACAALVQRWVEAYRNLDFLEHTADYPSFITQSFVPNWTERRPEGHDRWDCNKRWDVQHLYDACVGRKPQFCMESDGSASFVGMGVDTIKAVTTTHYQEYADLILEAQALIGFSESTSDMYKPTSQSLHDAFALTMTGGLQYRLSGGCERRETVDKCLLEWMDWILECRVTYIHVPVGTKQYMDDILSAHHFFRAALYGRSFILTEKGYFGFAPNSCQARDVVAILFGAKSPCVLRPVNDVQTVPETHFKLLGTSYVHGIMHGEVLEGLEDGDDLPTTTFHVV
ncbi:hypothetical protein GCG54_00014572 [Colletotrichum gloeosporioides]|uniref:Heterokaryon incompatibility domain-containing protein n=1 Tax=Colletotrichum gloeosporioides TaxID=474922 RepID=A0A8H4CXT5_COLGL|nr:uncharacterized protein GCG54_00014572 [Colletotrichum gloeosporioides]KAF3811816.1 hypothetical protein GCG54_00014572 [Colletotrichum gloeosporioides]